MLSGNEAIQEGQQCHYLSWNFGLFKCGILIFPFWYCPKKKQCGIFVLYSKQEITIHLQIKNLKNNLLSNFSQLSIHTSSQQNFA